MEESLSLLLSSAGLDALVHALGCAGCSAAIAALKTRLQLLGERVNLVLGHLERCIEQQMETE